MSESRQADAKIYREPSLLAQCASPELPCFPSFHRYCPIRSLLRRFIFPCWRSVRQMKQSIVIVRAYGGKPLRRVAVGSNRGTVHIVNPDRMEGVNSGWSAPVGFPNRDVFCFDTMTWNKISGLWERTGKLSPKDWERLVPFKYNPEVSRETVAI